MSNSIPDQEKYAAYANPEMLVSTSWVAEHRDDPQVVLVESNEDVLLYDIGHIPGAVKIDWHTELNDQTIRDYLSAESFAQLMSDKGIGRDQMVVFYGDNYNWWAAYALWVFSLFQHPQLRLMDGGRQKWVAEGRPLTTEKPVRSRTDYPVSARQDTEIRAFLSDAAQFSQTGQALIDVRSPEEFRGERLHMPEYPNEGALRGGHIPGAANIPWKTAANEDGTFKSAEELKEIYGTHYSPEEPVIAYCRIGERSSHTWFVLSHLLGYQNVRNYDGSWTEYGNAVGMPIEKP